MGLGVFELLAHRELSASQVAGRLRISVRGTTILLRALAALGLLVERGRKFCASGVATDFLTKEGRHTLWGAVRHTQNLMRCWAELEKCVKTGQPCSVQAATDRELARRRADFMLAMENNATLVADEIYRKGGISKCRRILDIGCGPARFATEFARRNPGLRGTLLDIKEVISIVVRKLCDAHIDERFSTVAGDFRKARFGVEQFDTGFLSHVIHMYDPANNMKLFKKIYQALEPRGRVIIHDFVLSDDGTRPAEAAIFAVNMLVGTCGGSCYTRPEIFAWLKRAGFTKPRHIPLRGDTSLIIADKKN
jgi:SAM-dependent methyltransferase